MEDSYLDTYWENQYDIEPSFEQHEDYNAFEEQQIFEDERLEREDEYSSEPQEDFGYFGEAGLWD